MTRVTSQALQRVEKGTAEKQSRQATARKLAGAVQTWRGVIVRSRHKQLKTSRHHKISSSAPTAVHGSRLSVTKLYRVWNDTAPRNVTKTTVQCTKRHRNPHDDGILFFYRAPI